MHDPLFAVDPALVVARTVRGVEPLVAEEVHRRRLGSVRELRHREVWFESADPWLAPLRTADDVLLAVAVADGIGRARSALRRLARAARDLDASRLMRYGSRPASAREPGGTSGPETSAPLLTAGDAPGPQASAPLPAVGDAPGLEVSASFVGRRNYTRFEIEDAVGAELAGVLGRPYHSRAGGAVPPPGCVAWRVTIEGERALIALRASARPLHRRPYKIGSIAGTLHPPLAAAMAALGGLGGGLTVLDPCCGAGTTLIEASALAPDARLLGLDRDPRAVATAAANSARMLAASMSSAAGRLAWDLPSSNVPAPDAPTDGLAPDLPTVGRPSWGVADAGRIPVSDARVNRVLVNPPWGRQVPPSGLLARDPGRLWREVRRVLTDDGVVVALLHDTPEDPPGFEAVRRVEVSLSGQHPVITVLRRLS